MQLPELAELAKALFPTNQCRFIKPGSTVASKFEHAAQSHDGRDIDEVFRRMEEPGSWLALWLQVAGRKTLNVWEPTDRVTVPGSLVEDFILTGSLSEVVLKEEHRSRSHEFDVGPGDGVVPFRVHLHT